VDRTAESVSPISGRPPDRVACASIGTSRMPLPPGHRAFKGARWRPGRRVRHSIAVESAASRAFEDALPDAAGDDEAANDRHMEDGHVAWSVQYAADPRRPRRWHVVADACSITSRCGPIRTGHVPVTA